MSKLWTVKHFGGYVEYKDFGGVSYNSLIFELTLQRKSLFYIVNLIVSNTIVSKSKIRPHPHKVLLMVF